MEVSCRGTKLLTIDELPRWVSAMSTAFLVSYLVLWALFLVQSVIVLMLLRQVGVLHLRIAPTGARILPIGPRISQTAPAVTIRDMENPNEQLQVEQSMERDVLLFFVSPGCAACGLLMPALTDR
jgi:methylamine dehydrogenase accessory protein MauD